MKELECDFCVPQFDHGGVITRVNEGVTPIIMSLLGNPCTTLAFLHEGTDFSTSTSADMLSLTHLE